MDPKRYSLIREHDKHFQIHDATTNTHFDVAKKGLHPATQIKVMKLQKFDDGGEVDDEEGAAAPQEAPPQDQSQPDFGGIGQMAQLPGPQAQPGWQAPMLPPGQMPDQAQGGSAEMPIQGQAAPSSQGSYTQPGLNEQAQGIRQAGGAQMQAAKDQGKAFQDYQNSLAQSQKDYAKKYATIDGEQQDLKKQFAGGKIDPNRYFKNMDTGHRISTAIGLILGGIGSGLTHGPNLAFQLMNKAVDNDIESQKADLGKTRSLLTMNMEKYHNTQAAEVATRLQYNTALQAQLQMAQSKATNGAAAAAIHMGLGQLDQKDAQYKQQLALFGMHASGLGATAARAGEGGINEGEEGPLLMDPKYRETRVVANGKAYSAADKDSADKVRGVETLAGPVVDGVQRLKELALEPSTKFAGTPSNQEAHSIMAGLSTRMPLLAGAQIGAKRVNDAEVKAQAERFQDPTRFDQSLAGVKSDNFLNELQHEVESMRTQHLIGYKGSGSIKSFQPASGKLPMNK